MLLACLLIGCATTPKKNSYRTDFQQGNIIEAEKTISGQKNKNDKLLRDIQLASIDQVKFDYTASNNRLEESKVLADELAAVSVSETIAAISINQRVSKFGGNDFERIMIYFHKALNYLAMDDAPAARIEISQAETLMQELRISTSNFPFLPLFLALIYEKIGDVENALVAYRRAIDAYKDGTEPSILKQGYLRLLSKHGRRSELAKATRTLKTTLETKVTPLSKQDNQASLIVIVPRGIMTKMGSFTIYHVHPELKSNFLIALPVYSEYAGVKAAPLLNLQRQSADAASSLPILFANIINVELEMRAALNKEMPKITSLALARAVVKNQIQQQADGDSLAALFVFAVNTITEVADTRSWDLLPQAFYFSRLELQPGDYSLNYADRNPTNFSIKEGINFLFLPNYRG